MAKSCQKCAACCLEDRPHHGHYVYLFPEDKARLTTAEIREHVVVVPHHSTGYTETYLATVPWRGDIRIRACTFLRQMPDGTYACAIYDRRPTLCREFEPDSEDCEEAIAESRFEGWLTV